jgi:hypothetical protein
MYKKFIFIAFVLLAIAGCKKSFDPGATKAKDIANEWWVNLYQGGKALYGSYGKIATYNTATNTDTMWIDDLGNIWQFKIRSPFNPTDLTFKATNAPNYWPNYPITVTVTDGKVMLKAAKSATGVVTDSIYFKVVFSDDPNTTYEIKGTARTGWAEDDY